MRKSAQLVALLSLQMLCACQYVSYYKTNTTRAPSGLQESPEVVCSAMGATRGDSTFDRCVAEEEDRGMRQRDRDAGN